jgi:flagellar hook-associated protein 3 FlgL
VKAEADAADTAVQNAVKLLEHVSSLATQGATSLTDANQRQNLAQEVEAVQEQLVALSRTSVGGRFIFSGDRDQEPAYTLDLSAPTGVDRLFTTAATQQIQDADGTSFTASRTAQDIFDHRNADDTPAADNVFAAVNTLRLALQNNDPDAIKGTIDTLHTVSDSLNAKLSYYGTVQNRISAALDRASKSAVQLKADLSSVQDTDLPAATVAMSQGQVQQEATLAAQAKMPKTSLFDFLA